MRDLTDDLAALDAFRGLAADECRRIASLCQTRQIAAGGRLLEQGRPNTSLFFLRTGLAAVSVRRDGGAETIAHLSPPAVIGEVSFLTGRPCSADVDVLVDATFAELSLEALGTVPESRARLIQSLALVLADRLHASNTLGRAPAQSPIVLLRPGPRWAAPTAFGAALAQALADARTGDALLVAMSPDDDWQAPASAGVRLWRATVGTSGSPELLRSRLAAELPAWSARFAAIVLSGPGRGERADDAVSAFASHGIVLAGPDDPVPSFSDDDFVVQDASQPTLVRQSVRHRLMPECALAERAIAEGRPLPERFAQTVASLARAILGTSVGWVLGAGGARGWSHIGILEVFTRARLPVDAVAGSSMGALIGGLVAQGTPVGELRRVMGEWPRRVRRLRELRAWRMHMASEHGVESLLTHFFQDRPVPALGLPYAANAVDIESGEEVVIRQGRLRDAARASMAFPGWLPPFRADGRLLVDGATLNPVPVEACRALGADMIIAVNVLGPLVPRPVSRRWPARQFDILMRTFQLSGFSMGRAHGVQGDVVLTPDLGDAMMHSFERFDEMIAGGVREGEARVEAALAAYARWCQARPSRVGSPTS